MEENPEGNTHSDVFRRRLTGIPPKTNQRKEGGDWNPAPKE